MSGTGVLWIPTNLPELPGNAINGGATTQSSITSCVCPVGLGASTVVVIHHPLYHDASVEKCN